MGGFFLHGGIPVIFDGVIGSALELPGEVGPLIAEIFVEEKEEPLLVDAPFLLIYIGVEMVVPPFSALFADAT
jgi:hypothetical protein